MLLIRIGIIALLKCIAAAAALAVWIVISLIRIGTAAVIVAAVIILVRILTRDHSLLARRLIIVR
jgi:hypothetical protein